MLSGGLWHRPADRVIIKEVRATYAELPIRAGDVVLDLGANIGASARLFLDKGAARVIAVEADPMNVAVLRRNLVRRPAVMLWAAVGRTAGRTKIHVRPGKPYLSSILADSDRIAVTVPQVTLGGLLAQFHPTVVKCDIEFGEYELPELARLPAFVRVLALEVHVRYDLVFANRSQTEAELLEQRQRAADLLAAVEGQGFREVWRRDKQAKAGPVHDDTGLGPLVKSIDAIWSR